MTRAVIASTIRGPVARPRAETLIKAPARPAIMPKTAASSTMRSRFFTH